MIIMATCPAIINPNCAQVMSHWHVLSVCFHICLLTGPVSTGSLPEWTQSRCRVARGRSPAAVIRATLWRPLPPSLFLSATRRLLPVDVWQLLPPGFKWTPLARGRGAAAQTNGKHEWMYGWTNECQFWVTAMKTLWSEELYFSTQMMWKTNKHYWHADTFMWWLHDNMIHLSQTEDALPICWLILFMDHFSSLLLPWWAGTRPVCPVGGWQDSLQAC